MALVLLFLTGIRLGEVLALEYSDFDIKSSSVCVNKSFSANVELDSEGNWGTRTWSTVNTLKQNSEPRTINVPDEVFNVLNDIKQIQKQKMLIRNQLFSVCTPYPIQDRLYKLCDDLNILKRSPHKCRKTYISQLLNNGMDADFVRLQVGHKELKTTFNSYVYSTTRPEEKIKKLNEILAI